MTKKERYKKVIEYFKLHRPKAETELIYASPYELIVAVILSAQCTDKRVNIITPHFFKQFPSAQYLAKASEDEIYKLIKSCSYPNNKAKHLSGMAKMLINRFNNEVPSNTNDLQKLPGVGRKTANVIAAVIYNKPVIPVDTHVYRVAKRVGLATNAKTPIEVEKQLTYHIPPVLRPLAHHWLILHGRYICQARKPKCDECGITAFCRYFEKIV